MMPLAPEIRRPHLTEDFDSLMDVFPLSRTVRKARTEITEGMSFDHRTAVRQFREILGL